MSFFSDVYTVGTATPVEIVPPVNTAQHVILYNEQKSSNHYIYIGTSPAMAKATSTHINSEETRQFLVPPNDKIYALGEANGYKIGVLRWYY